MITFKKIYYVFYEKDKIFYPSKIFISSNSIFIK